MSKQQSLQVIAHLAHGNPGAVNATIDIIEKLDAVAIEELLIYLIENNIIGTDLYVFYSDLCNRDPFLMYMLIKDCPKDILKEATSRQDYSGRQLVKPYQP